MMHTADTAVIVVCGLALVAAVTVARAQGLNDPTRPPAALENPATAAGDAPAAATGLQTTIRSSCGKPGAIINGEYVLLGGRVGDARLVRISEDSVTLKGPAGRETLKLIQGVEKTLVAHGRIEAEQKGACVRTVVDEVRK